MTGAQSVLAGIADALTYVFALAVTEKDFATVVSGYTTARASVTGITVDTNPTADAALSW